MSSYSNRYDIPLRLYLGAAVLLLCAAHGASGAVVIARYTFDSGSATSSDTEANTTASDFTSGVFTGGTVNSTNVNISSSTNNAYIRAATSPDTTAADAVANDDSWSFTVTPNPGVAMNLTSLDFKPGSNGSSSTSFTSNFVVRSSLDNYASDLGSGVYSKTTTGSTGQFVSASIDLSGDPNFQNITGPVTFKFFEFDSSTSSSDIARIDDVVLSGTVPEPAGMAILGIGAMATLLRRSRGSLGRARRSPAR